jgi:MtrB/PioB family decaheme-associated outer membrane protein
MKRTVSLFAVSLMIAVHFFPTSRAWAQIDVGNYTVGGEAEVGGLPQHRNGDRGKFEEYRDLPESVVVPHIELFIDSKKQDSYLHFEASNVGRNNQNYQMRFGRYGLLDVEFEWDQMPHLFNVDNARTPYVMRGGNFTLSSKPASNAVDTTAPAGECVNTGLCPWVNANATPVDLKLYNGIGKFKLRYTPTPGWTLTGGYWSNNNVGKRAFGSLFGASPGNYNITELAEPISYTSHNIELGGEYAGAGWSLGLKYNASLFHNNNSTLIWDNPLNRSGIGSGCTDSARYSTALTTGTDGNRGPCRGQLDLYPSNQAHTFTLSGSASLPMKTQFMGTLSYGWRLQDDSFLPFTINSQITQPSLPRSSLNGDVRPLMINATLVNRSIEHLNLKAFYRFYDLNNRTKSAFFPQGIVINDQAGTVASPTCNPLCPEANYRTAPYQYSKNNMGLEAGYDITRWLAAKFAYVYERTHRSGLDVRNSSEHTIGPTFDIKPSSWVLVRAGYKHSWRDAPGYDFADKRFFEAQRVRDRISLFSQISPLEQLSFHAGFEFTGESYPDTTNGTQNDVNYSPSIGLIYAPAEWLKFFADYNWDRYDWRLDARSTTTWFSRGRDSINTFSLGSDIDLIPNLLGIRLQYGFSDAVSKVFASGNAGANAATNYPSIINRWHEFLARLEYKFHKNIGLNLGYYYNGYKSKDYGVDIMKVWMGDVDTGANVQRSIFLGDQLKGSYMAHVGFVGLKIKF